MTQQEEAILRQFRAQAEWQSELMRQQRVHEAGMGMHRGSRQPSRFNGPEVIDFVPAADGSYYVPAALEAQVRKPF